MRIVHLGKYYPPASGGIETHTQTLARAQAELGSDVTVVVVNHTARDGSDVTFRPTVGTPTVKEIDGRVRVHRLGRLRSVARLDVAPGMFKLLRRLKRDRPDVWHVHTPNPAMLLALAVDAALRPLVVTHHSDVVRQRLLRHVMQPFERIVYGRASALLVSSPAYVEGSASLLRVRNKVVVIPLGLDLSPFFDDSERRSEAVRAIRSRREGPLWLVVGRLIYYKALDVALRALCDVPGSLVIVGTGPMDATWKALAQTLGVADRVVFLGSVPSDELVALYQAATALWFPSDARSEAFGLVQVEAMACGCPVINAAIPHSGVPWVSRHDETGLTVPVDDPTALAAAARRLLDEPNLRGRLSLAARAAARSRFDHREMARRTLDVYSKVIARHDALTPRAPSRARRERDVAARAPSPPAVPWAS